MPHDRLDAQLRQFIESIDKSGVAKRFERTIVGVVQAANGQGPRYLLEGHGETPFIRMNSNNYLGLSANADVIRAEEEAVRQYGTGPGAVRFISGTWKPHRELENKLAQFHKRDGAVLFSSAYSTVVGVLAALITSSTAVISDELNHNCIINAIRLGTPKEKYIYGHLALRELETHLEAASKNCQRAIIVTDGVFSMRGDYAPVNEIMALARAYDHLFSENVLVVVDDSHGVGAFGGSGRGTEEVAGGDQADLLVATLGKAFGVNGGYAVGPEAMINYLRETSPLYIYSNPITPAEAAAASKSIDIVQSEAGTALLRQLRERVSQFERGMNDLGLEGIPGPHPVTPLLVRSTKKTLHWVNELFDLGVLATGLGFPVVPRGEEEIRFQVSADHTSDDIHEVIDKIAHVTRKWP